MNCLYWIEKAEAYNVVVTGRVFALEKQLEAKNKQIEELQRKLADAEQSHDQLVEEFNKMRDDFLRTQGQLADCNEKYDKLTNSFAGKGDISP
jgi:peptidoglycan hydrolase CwlO-like protein